MRGQYGYTDSAAERADNFARSGGVPPWAPIFGGLMVAIIMFVAIVRLGGPSEVASEDPLLEGASAILSANDEAARPSAPSAAEVSAAPETTTVVVTTTQTVLDSNGNSVELPAEVVTAATTHLDSLADDVVANFSQSTVLASSETNWVIDLGFTTEAGRFFSFEVSLDLVDGTWVPSS